MQGGDTGVHQVLHGRCSLMKNVESVVIKQQQKFAAKNACPGAFKYFWSLFKGFFSVNKSILYGQY